MSKEYHALADTFPLLEGAAFNQFVEDIQSNGLHHPITLFEGKILDGRNRYRACLEANIKPRFVDYAGDDPVAFVVSENLHRRHLNEAQRAIVAAKIINMKMGTNQRVSKFRDPGVSPSSSDTNAEISASKAGAMLNIGQSTIWYAKTVLEDAAPEVVQEVEGGRMSLHRAHTISELPKDKQVAAIKDKTVKGKTHSKKKKKGYNRRGLPPVENAGDDFEKIVRKHFASFWTKLLYNQRFRGRSDECARIIVKYLTPIVNKTINSNG